MNESSFISLIHNAALLLGIALIFDLATEKLHTNRKLIWQVPFGLVIGGIGILIMLTPWVYIPGVVIDTRSILLGMSGLFFGAVPTLIAMALTAAFRIYQGGSAALTGVSVILATGAAGIAWRHFRRAPLADVTWRQLYGFGVLIHILMLGLFFLLPWETALQVLGVISLPVLAIYPIATTVLGVLLVRRLKHERVSEELRDSEERLRLAVAAANIGFFDKNLLSGSVHFSREWKRQLGYEPDELANESLEWSQRLHPDDREGVLSMETAFGQGLRNDYEDQYRLRHKDGSYRWILARGQRQLDPTGKPVRVVGCHIDVTDQIHIQETLAASEQRFRGLAESSQDYIMLYDREFRHVYENPAALRVSGLTEADIIGKTHREAGFDEELSDLWETDIHHVFSTRASSQRLFEWDSVDGKVFLDLRLSPVYGKDSQVEQVMGISRDITALKKAELALQKSEELYRVLTESIIDVVWILDTQTLYFRYISPSAEPLLGYTTQEILAVPVNYYLGKEAGESLVALTRRRANDFLAGSGPETGFYTDEIEQPCKSGSTVWTEVITNYYTNLETGHVEVRGVTRDIHARRQAEAQRESALEGLHHSEIQYHSLFENLINGFAYCRMLYENDLPCDFVYLDVNHSFHELTGLGDVIGKKVTDVIPGVRASDPEIFNIYGRVALTGTPESFETYVSSLDDWYAISVYSPQKEYFVAVFDVITDRKKAEENLLITQAELQNQLVVSDQSRRVLLSVVEDQRKADEQIRQLNSELEQRVQHRTAQLETVNRELEAFAYSVSHDLRAPLRAMDGFSEALLADYAEQLDAQGQHYLDRIREASQRMGQLITDLLNLSRITRAQLDRQNVNLSEIANEISAALHANEPTRQVEFDITPELIVVGDPRLLRIALENLLNNAFKFTSKREQAKISLGVTEHEGERVIFVRDNGAGFDMAYSTKLFAPFQRLHAADEYPGTGIGLVTIQRIIARHGGHIWPEAELDQGATFYFTLGGVE